MYTRREFSTLGQNHSSSARNTVTESERECSRLEIQYEIYTLVSHEVPYMSRSGTFVLVLGIVLGTVLVVLGVGAYVLSDFVSVTALIPAFFGVLIAVLGVVGYQRTDRQRLPAYGIGALAVRSAGIDAWNPGHTRVVTGGAVESTIAVAS